MMAAPVFCCNADCVGTMVDSGALRAYGEIRLPADPCWIEVADHYSAFFRDRGALGLDYWVFVKNPWGAEVDFRFEGQIKNNGERWHFVLFRESLRADVGETEKHILSLLLGMAVAVATRIVDTQEKELSTGRKMHARKGRGRVFRHYDILLNEQAIRPKGASHGGTHAPPAWHIRRGHMRRLKDGRLVFVRSCEVGNKERGVVLKDYRVGEGVARPEHSR